MMSLNASRTSVRRAAAPVRAVRARAEETKAPEAPVTPEQPTNLTAGITENAPSTSRGVIQDAKDTVKPRVNELRRQQLSQGTTSFERAPRARARPPHRLETDTVRGLCSDAAALYLHQRAKDRAPPSQLPASRYGTLLAAAPMQPDA